MGDFWVFSKPSVPTQSHDAKEGFGEDSARHFTCPKFTVDKDNGNLLNLESAFEGGELHLYLECVTLETYFIKL